MVEASVADGSAGAGPLIDTSVFGHLDFEVGLNETSDTIDLVCDGMTLPEPATVALESWDGSRSSVPFVVPQPIVYARTRARSVPP